MCFKLIIFLVLFILKVQSEQCVTPNNEKAECIALHSCQILFETANQGSSGDEFIQKSICGGTKFSPKVCCGSLSNFTLIEDTQKKQVNKSSLLPNRGYCGYQHSDDYFRQENDTSVRINEFPWLANLLYRDNQSGLQQYRCCGSLINKNYVLSAAHCLQKTGNFELKGVRLGAYYYTNKTDCIQEPPFDQECSEIQDYGIEKIITHPRYSVFHNDIGLIRLNRRVQYSDYVRPICLPQPGIILAKVGDTLTSSGWGVTYTGFRKELKKKAFNTLVAQEECSRTYTKWLNITENQFCSTALANSTDLQCKYDSGGPIMFSNGIQWHQEGILSFGPRLCGISPDVLSRRDEELVDPLCESEVYTDFPTQIKNLQNETKHIINDRQHRQAVIYETCIGTNCDRRVTFPVGYVGVCIQKYSTVRLLTINLKGEPAYDTFVVPSSCVCGIKRDLPL